MIELFGGPHRFEGDGARVSRGLPDSASLRGEPANAGRATKPAEQHKKDAEEKAWGASDSSGADSIDEGERRGLEAPSSDQNSTLKPDGHGGQFVPGKNASGGGRHEASAAGPSGLFRRVTKEVGHEAAPDRVAVIRPAQKGPLLPFAGSHSAVAEQYRLIGTKLRQHHGQPRLVLISSPQAGDGKSVNAINLAAALALNEETRVLLADTDLRRSSIAKTLGVAHEAGVSDVLSGGCSFDEAAVRLAPFRNLFFLGAGKKLGSPAELLSSPKWKELCGEIRGRMTYAVFDGPPVDSVADYRLLEEALDGVLLVVRTDRTKRPLLYGALDSIPREKLIGTVVNSYRQWVLWQQRGDYQLYSYSSKEGGDVSQS